MKPLQTIRKYDYVLGYERTIFGYYKKGIIVQGYNSFGPVAIYCKDMKEAEALIQEEEYEDSYARLIAKPGKMFIELNTEEIYQKIALRRKRRFVKPEPECKGILYSWDGTPLELFYGSFTDFSNFKDLGPGDKLVWWMGEDKYTRTCEYSFNDETMYFLDEKNGKLEFLPEELF